MTYIAMGHQMRELDRRAIQDIRIPGIVLMENAGRETVRALSTHWSDFTGARCCIVCGRGNNGGDGFVIARHLWNRGADVAIYLLGTFNQLKGDAETNAQAALRMNIPYWEVTELTDLEQLRYDVAQASFVVDAIFGTGLTKPVEGLYAEAIQIINTGASFVVSVDMPSGLQTDSPAIFGPAVCANLTVTYGLPKPALLLYPAADLAGQVVVADISIPPEVVDAMDLKGATISPFSFPDILFPRERHAHKGSYGHLLVIGGSPGKTGAAVLASQAALRVGTGLVTNAIPDALNPILEIKLTEAMTAPVPGKDAKLFGTASLEPAKSLITGKSAVLLGPGIGTDPETRRFTLDFIDSCSVPLVIDADGLNNICGHTDILFNRPTPTVLTPHPGEMARLMDCSIEDIIHKQLELLPEFAATHGVYLVFKTARTLIVRPDGSWRINITGNPGLASGGTGDVLAGMIAGLLAQTIHPAQLTHYAVFVHGLAGDLAAADLGERELVAGDLFDYFAEARWQLDIDAERFNGRVIPYPRRQSGKENDR